MFDFIAPIYGLFYARQKRRFNAVIDEVQDIVDFSSFENIIDIGCGTGALCSVFRQKGLAVTGVDQSQKMLDIASRKRFDQSIEYVRVNALELLPFAAKSFDVAIASYVAHGLKASERKSMYAQMSRVAKKLIIIYDYNDKRSVMTNVIEQLEGGNYSGFIKQVIAELKMQFDGVQVIEVGPRAAWYLCVPKEQT